MNQCQVSYHFAVSFSLAFFSPPLWLIFEFLPAVTYSGRNSLQSLENHVVLCENLTFLSYYRIRPNLFSSKSGWIDNFNGPTGLLIACGIGLLRTSYGDPDVVSDFTPVDTSIKAMIVAAWKRGIQSHVPEVPVYNCSTSIQRKFTTGFIIEMGRKLARDVPLDHMMWLPGGSITRCKYNNYFRVRLFTFCRMF